MSCFSIHDSGVKADTIPIEVGSKTLEVMSTQIHKMRRIFKSLFSAVY